MLELNVFNVLRLIRDNKANNLRELSVVLATKTDLRGSGAIRVLESMLDTLERNGVIQLVSAKSDARRYKVSEKFLQIQQALELSLTQLGKLQSPSAFIAEPFFGRPSSLQGQIDIFVLMPFTEKLKPIWDGHIKKIATSLGLTARRADDFFTVHSVMTDVWNAIWMSRIIIADCTGRNPNVFYEIGVAHTVGKPVILCTQDPNDVPFDLRHIRYIQYEYTPRGMQDFESSLAKKLKSIIDKTGQV